MYTKKGKTYSEAGHALKKGAALGLEFDADGGITEHAVGGVEVGRGYAVLQGACAVPIKGLATYAEVKARLVKLRYSIDDQIAVMLNGDAAEAERMQQWRQWAADTAKEICRKAGIKH